MVAAHSLWPGLWAYSLVAAQAHKFVADSLADIVEDNRFALADRPTGLEDIAEAYKPVDFELGAVARLGRLLMVGAAAQSDLNSLVALLAAERCAEFAVRDDPML